MQNAFYELLHAESYEQGLEDTILRGGDTDTNGCITGALLGARFGFSNIPQYWIDCVKDAPPRTNHRMRRQKQTFSYMERKHICDKILTIKDADVFLPELCRISDTWE